VNRVEEVMKLAVNQGIWAALAVALIFYILKAQERRDVRQEEREVKYQDIISSLSDKLNVLDDIKKGVEEIKSCTMKEWDE